MYQYQCCFYAIEYINGIALCDQSHLMCCEVWMTLNRLASNSFLVIEWMITAVKAIKSFDLIAWAGITKGSCRVPTGKWHSWERLTHNEPTILGQTEQVQKSPFSLRTTGVGSLNSLALFSTWRRRWTGRGFATSSGKMTCLLRRLVIENFPQFWRARRAQGLLMVLIIIYDCMHVQLNVWEIVSRRERERVWGSQCNVYSIRGECIWNQCAVKLRAYIDAPRVRNQMLFKFLQIVSATEDWKMHKAISIVL